MDKAIEEMQNELKVLKNEIKETLTDIREYLLTNVENPFPAELARMAVPRQATEAPQVAPQPSTPPQDDGAAVGRGPTPAASAGPAPGAPPPPPGTNPVEDYLPGSGAAAPAQPFGREHIAQGRPLRASQSAPSEDRPAAEEQGPAAAAAEPARPEPARGWTDELAEEPCELPATRDEAPVAEESLPDSKPRTGERTTGMLPEREEVKAAAQKEAPDLVTVALLAPWVESSISRVGRERLKLLVEIYESVGGLHGQHKEVLLKLITLDGRDVADGNVPLKECLRMLVELDNLLSRSRFDPNGAALLSLFLDGKRPARAR